MVMDSSFIGEAVAMVGATLASGLLLWVGRSIQVMDKRLAVLNTKVDFVIERVEHLEKG